MTPLLGILLIMNAHGATIMQPFPATKPTVCVAAMGDKYAQCYEQGDKVQGTPGYVANQQTITIKVEKDGH